ncbi:hypothetical protein GCM10010170_022490 [Dactylosporangium salmoneum]|uniref:Uncharacterized protein n=1 Tax=Dactylosporangium salmoneum TaxID=53361 RepID=A0ABN3FXR4_9ACTN
MRGSATAAPMRPPISPPTASAPAAITTISHGLAVRGLLRDPARAGSGRERFGERDGILAPDK